MTRKEVIDLLNGSERFTFEGTTSNKYNTIETSTWASVENPDFKVSVNHWIGNGSFGRREGSICNTRGECGNLGEYITFKVMKSKNYLVTGCGRNRTVICAL